MERSIDALDPRVASMCRNHIENCRANGIEIIVTSTYRDPAEQDRLYARGRTIKVENGKPVKIVTNAKGGQSFHNYRLAYDVVPLRYGKPVWGTVGADLDLWEKVGELGKVAGLDWAGDWVRFKEFPHFQWTGGLTLKDLQAGKRP